MVSQILSLVVLATTVLAHPQRHHRWHAHSTGTGGVAVPTGGAFPLNGTSQTNSTNFGGSPVESQATAVLTVTNVAAPSSSSTPSEDTGLAAGLDASSASISLAAGTPTAGAFFGRPSNGDGGFSSAPEASASSVVMSVVPTTLATMASSAPGSSAASGTVPTASSVSSSTPSTGGGSSGGKKGLSYNTASLTDAFAGKGISWVYNWGSTPDGSPLSGTEYVPMFWGSQSVSGWSSAVQSAISSGSKHVLSINEPDLASQANLDPQTAAKLHIANVAPLSGQVSIGSPAVTNGAGTSPLMGIDWLNEFFSACGGNCNIDFVAFHWYSDAGQIGNFKQHVQDVINAAAQNGVSKVWLTEFGATGSDSDVASFLGEAIPFLESTAAVERYAYFMCSDGILVNGNSISSPIGEAYL
ncbi:hypothetical protein RBB50_005690 [Rhinocladiella similis]